MIFSKVKFVKNAGRAEKMALKNHLDALEGKEVNANGEIEYEVDGKEYYLYPVMPEWCEGGDTP